MKKNSTSRRSPKQEQETWRGPLTIGMDLEDRASRYCVLDSDGEVVNEGSVGGTNAG
jgi:hypothetical protein